MPVPGWYPDPLDPQLRRWWDGVGWTDDTAPLHAPPQPTTGVPPPPSPTGPPPSQTAPRPSTFGPPPQPTIGTPPSPTAGGAGRGPASGAKGARGLVSALGLVSLLSLGSWLVSTVSDTSSDDVEPDWTRPAESADDEPASSSEPEPLPTDRTLTVTRLPTSAEAQQQASSLAERLSTETDIPVAGTFSGSEADDQDAAGQMFMSLAVCGPQEHHDTLTSIVGVHLEDDLSEGLLMVGTAEVEDSRSFADALIAQARSCPPEVTGHPHDRLEVHDTDETRLLELVRVMDEGEGETSWVFHVRAAGDVIVGSYLRVEGPSDPVRLDELLRALGEHAEVQLHTYLDTGVAQ